MQVIQNIRGATATEDARVLPSGTISVDTTRNELRLHDGVTPGGHRILNVDQFFALGQSRFTAVATLSAPGVMPDTSAGKLNRITAAGTYTLPSVGTLDVGGPLIVQAMVAGVTIQRTGAELINNAGVDLTTLALTQYETVQLAKLDVTKFIILNRY